MQACAKLDYMPNFEDLFDARLIEIGTTLRQVALSVGEDPTRVDKIVYMKRPVTFETRLQTARILSESPLLKGKLSYPEMAAWLVNESLPRDILKAAYEMEMESIDPKVLEAIRKHRAMVKETRRRVDYPTRRRTQ